MPVRSLEVSLLTVCSAFWLAGHGKKEMRRLLCPDCLTALPCAGSSSAHGWRRTASVLLVLSLYTAIYHSFSHAPPRLSRAADRNIKRGAAGRAGDSRRDWSRRGPRWRRWRGCCARSRWSVRRGSQHTAKICFLNYSQSAAVLGWPASRSQLHYATSVATLDIYEKYFLLFLFNMAIMLSN